MSLPELYIIADYAQLRCNDSLSPHNHDYVKQGRFVFESLSDFVSPALVEVGIQDFRWHDLRHTWASWHVQTGTPLHVLQELGGWSDIRMVQRYAHLALEHLSKYADRLCELKPVPATFLATPESSNKKSG